MNESFFRSPIDRGNGLCETEKKTNKHTEITERIRDVVINIDSFGRTNYLKYRKAPSLPKETTVA